MEILRKRTVSAEFEWFIQNWKCEFPQNFHTTKLGEIAGFYAVVPNDNRIIVLNQQEINLTIVLSDLEAAVCVCVCVYFRPS